VVRELRFAPGSMRAVLDVTLPEQAARGARTAAAPAQAGRAGGGSGGQADSGYGTEQPDRQPEELPEGQRERAPERQPADQPPASEGIGHLIADTLPRSRVLVDGHDTGWMTPIRESGKLGLRPGAHVVTFVVGDRRHSFDVIIRAGEVTSLVRQLDVDY
jgi:hypothetical protein